MDLPPGTYVLASKWSDGDPCDPFALGILGDPYFGRHLVYDLEGKCIYGGGFRKIREITPEQADKVWPILQTISDVPGSPSIWEVFDSFT